MLQLSETSAICKKSVYISAVGAEKKDCLPGLGIDFRLENVQK